MPIYEYECPKCGQFETTQRITEPPLKKCPACGAKIRKLISNSSFQLKGSGWYLTDYARRSEKQKETKEKVAQSGSREGSADEGRSNASKKDVAAA